MTSTITEHSIKSETKQTYLLGIPLIASSLIYASSGFVGTIMVAKLGEDALAASVLVSMIWASLCVLFFGILNSVSVLVSHQFGAKNDTAISNIMGQAYKLGLVISIVMIAILSAVPYFLRLSHQPQSVLLLAYQYMHSLLWTIPALNVLIILEQFLAGINRAKLVLRISMIVVPIEIPLIYILIFGKFGLPAFGVAGVGYGFAITYSLTAIFLAIYLFKARFYQRFQIYKQTFTIDFKYIKELISVGLPMGFMHGIEVSTFAIATFWIGYFGTTYLAAHQIVMQYLGFAITLVFAMSQAVTIRVGHAVGRQDVTGIRYAIYVGMILNLFIILLVALAFMLFPRFFISLDINIHDANNIALINDTSKLLAICGVLLIFDNFRIICFGALRGLKDTRFPMWASFVSFWLVGLVSAYLFAFKCHFGGASIWWGLTLGIASGAVILFIRLHFSLKKIDSAKLAKLMA